MQGEVEPGQTARSERSVTTRAVILARGLGTRMRRDDRSSSLSDEQKSVADAGVKAMMPVGRPFLDYVLSGLADAGVRDVCLVIGPEHEQVRIYYMEQVRVSRLRIHFAVQAEARGTADALLAARDFAGVETFLVLNADNYYPVKCFRTLAEFAGPALPGFDPEALIRFGNIDRERIRHYALLQVGSDGFLEDIVEKPDEETFARMGQRALVSMNLWSFGPDIFEACRLVGPSSRGEIELPRAVRYAMRHLGQQFRVFPVSAGVLDLSNRGDVGPVTERLRDVEVRL